MQMEGLIPFKSSIDQAIGSLYFLRISNSCCSLGLINAADIITSFAFSSSKKAYFNCLGNSFKVNPLELIFFSFAFSSLLLIFLCCSHSNIRLFPLNQNSNSKIQNQDHEDTGNSSHFH